MNRVILSTALLIGEGVFEAKTLTLDEAKTWLNAGPVENFCGHETVKILGLDPATERKTCQGYDEALCLGAKSRLEFRREYTVQEIALIGINITLIKRVPTINDILALAAQLPSGLNDPRSAKKLVAERDEFEMALEEGDFDGALTEAADAAYYAAKHLDWVARQVDLSVDDVLAVAVAKYSLRARPGNPKDGEAERQACVAVIEGKVANAH